MLPVPVVVAQSSSDCNACMYFQFCGLRQVSHNGAKGPESKTPRMFRPVRQVAAPARSLLSPTASCYYYKRMLLECRAVWKTLRTHNNKNKIDYCLVSLCVRVCTMRLSVIHSLHRPTLHAYTNMAQENLDTCTLLIGFTLKSVYLTARK